MKIYIGADHNGFELKRMLRDVLVRDGYEVVDCGDISLNPRDDFPQFASQVVAALRSSDEAEPKAVLICGSGQGMAMAANRFNGVRASLCWDADEARAARNDDDSNVLCLPARFVDKKLAETIVTAWLTTPFAGAPRFKRRIKEMDELR